MKKDYHVNSNHEQTGLTIFISDKVDFERKKCY